MNGTIGLRRVWFLWLPLTFVLGGCIGYLYSTKFCYVSIGKRTNKELDLYGTMHRLWSDHVIWTRCYIISALENSPDLKATTARLLKNQEDIGAAMGSFYPGTASAITKLLKEHILIAADLVGAAQKKETAKVKNLNEKWHNNADEISKALSDLNPAWPYGDIQKMMYMHLDLTLQEAQARIDQKWDKDVVAFDKVYSEILDMANEFAAGIIEQFPEKF